MRTDVDVPFEVVVGELAEILEDPAYDHLTLHRDDHHTVAFRRSLELLHIRCLTVSPDPATRDEIEGRLRDLIRLATGPFAVYQEILARALVRVHGG